MSILERILLYTRSSSVLPDFSSRPCQEVVELVGQSPEPFNLVPEQQDGVKVVSLNRPLSIALHTFSWTAFRFVWRSLEIKHWTEKKKRLRKTIQLEHKVPFQHLGSCLYHQSNHSKTVNVEKHFTSGPFYRPSGVSPVRSSDWLSVRTVSHS